jgi:hypothetical protein
MNTIWSDLFRLSTKCTRGYYGDRVRACIASLLFIPPYPRSDHETFVPLINELLSPKAIEFSGRKMTFSKFTTPEDFQLLSFKP